MASALDPGLSGLGLSPSAQIGTSKLNAGGSPGLASHRDGKSLCVTDTGISSGSDGPFGWFTYFKFEFL